MSGEKISSGKRGRKAALIIAAAAAACSLCVIIYNLLWVPYHFSRMSEAVKNESVNSSQSEAYGIQPKYAGMKKAYSDYAGQLIIEGLNMDFPVVQCEDNSYYLRHTIDGLIDKHGALFADFRNNLSELDGNTVIYGHNMKDGTQFGMLNAYKDVRNYKSFPVVTFNTVYKDYKWKIFAAFLINTKAADDNGYVFNYTKTDFSSEKEFNEFYNEVLERSYFITDTDVKYGDKILTMSTCSTLFDDSRLVVMARLVREGENADTDTSSAYTNPCQRFPSSFDGDKK